MIIPSKFLRDYIEAFSSRAEACRHLDVSPDTLTRYLSKDQSCSTMFIENIKKIVGIDFEKAFDIVKEGK